MTTTYERDGYGRTRPVVDHTSDPLVPATPEQPTPPASLLERILRALGIKR